MAKVNYLLWESIERNQFVTAIYGILDGSSRTLSYSNAGHNPPLLLKAGGDARFLFQGEQPLGMFQHTRYHENHVVMEAGDVFVLYTDGATEAQSPQGEEYGRERLVEAVKAARDKTAREMVASIEMSVLEWTANVGADDDVTFFVIKALGA
jgi:sigma-B regulation protein RsbU (phosphoserine phosphatase)